jgi:hypothetical protein
MAAPRNGCRVRWIYYKHPGSTWRLLPYLIACSDWRPKGALCCVRLLTSTSREIWAMHATCQQPMLHCVDDPYLLARSSETCRASPSVMQNSWQNIYERIGPVPDVVLSAIVCVSMIADWPTEMAIIASDPQQKGAQASRGQLLEHNHVLKFAVQTHAIKHLDLSHFAISAVTPAHNLLRMPLAQPLHPRKGVHVKEVLRHQTHTFL